MTTTKTPAKKAATLYLYGSFWSREDAQAHADSLAQATEFPRPWPAKH